MITCHLDRQYMSSQSTIRENIPRVFINHNDCLTCLSFSLTRTHNYNPSLYLPICIHDRPLYRSAIAASSKSGKSLHRAHAPTCMYMHIRGSARYRKKNRYAFVQAEHRIMQIIGKSASHRGWEPRRRGQNKISVRLHSAISRFKREKERKVCAAKPAIMAPLVAPPCSLMNTCGEACAMPYYL